MAEGDDKEEKKRQRSIRHTFEEIKGLRIHEKNGLLNVRMNQEDWSEGDSIFFAGLCARGLRNEDGSLDSPVKPTETLRRALFLFAVEQHGYEKAIQLQEKAQKAGEIVRSGISSVGPAKLAEYAQ